jgi:uncharacterized membrane protein
MTIEKRDVKKEEPTVCPYCRGTGDHPYSWYDQEAVCQHCNGRGWIPVVVEGTCAATLKSGQHNAELAAALRDAISGLEYMSMIADQFRRMTPIESRVEGYHALLKRLEEEEGEG